MCKDKLMVGVHIYPTTIEYESRILRMTDALSDRSDIDRLIVYGFPKEGLLPIEKLNSITEVHRVGRIAKGHGTFSKIWRFLCWYIAVVMASGKQSPDVVNCHSLSVLPLSWVVAKLNNARLIYEPHELETETATMYGKRKLIAKYVESTLIKFADLILVVSDSIAQAYKDDYQLENVYVIKNSPSRIHKSELENTSIISYRKLFGIPDKDIVFLYQGALEEARGVLILLDAFSQSPDNCHIVFMGFGSLENRIKIFAENSLNIHYHPAVPAKDVLQYTLGADVGVAYLDRSCTNHEYALPNKFFQYLHSGKPVLCTDLVEMGQIVTHYQVGWKVDVDAESIRKKVANITSQQIQEFAENVPNAVADLNWQSEKDKLNQIYTQFLNG